MRSRSAKLTKKSNDLMIIAFSLMLAFAFISWAVERASAQDSRPQVGVRGFLDEDGDGFNDLIPDFDGDGVPNPIDPDWHSHRADSAAAHRELRGREDSTGMMHRMLIGPGFMPMEHHGEPGMFGPGDSTGHGGMMGDSSGHHHGGHGGWPPPDSMGGHGGDGGGRRPGPDRPSDPSERLKDIRSIPENNGEANGLAVPLRGNFKGEGENK